MRGGRSPPTRSRWKERERPASRARAGTRAARTDQAAGVPLSRTPPRRSRPAHHQFMGLGRSGGAARTKMRSCVDMPAERPASEATKCQVAGVGRDREGGVVGRDVLEVPTAVLQELEQPQRGGGSAATNTVTRWRAAYKADKVSSRTKIQGLWRGGAGAGGETGADSQRNDAVVSGSTVVEEEKRSTTTCRRLVVAGLSWRAAGVGGAWAGGA